VLSDRAPLIIISAAAVELAAGLAGVFFLWGGLRVDGLDTPPAGADADAAAAAAPRAGAFLRGIACFTHVTRCTLDRRRDDLHPQRRMMNLWHVTPVTTRVATSPSSPVWTRCAPPPFAKPRSGYLPHL